MHDLMALASNKNGSRIAREAAIRYLGMHGGAEALISITNQLVSSDPRIRTAAYYSLPEGVRPVNFDYTADPSEASRKLMLEVVEKVRQTK